MDREVQVAQGIEMAQGSAVRDAVAGLLLMAGVALLVFFLNRTPSESDNAEQPVAPPVKSAFSTPDKWPVFQGDSALTGYVDGHLPDKLTLAWTFKTGKAILSSAAVEEEIVCFGSNDGNVYALNTTNGEKIWSVSTGDHVESSPCFVDGCVYVGGYDGYLYAIDAASGEIKWKYLTDDRILGGVNFTRSADGISNWIIVGSYDGLLHCVNSETGKPVWTYETGNYVNGAPAIADGKAVFGGCDAYIHVVSIKDGSLIETLDAGSYIAGSIALDGDKAYLGHYGERLIGIDLAKGEIEWEYRDKDYPYFSSPAITRDRVVIGCRDKQLHCVRRSNGEKIWTFKTRGKVDSSPVICGDKVIVGSNDGRLYMVRLSDGELVWSYEIGRPVSTTAAIARGMVFVGAEDGVMYAFRAEENETKP
jgi:eukaryotic-like serine/threonine-protein kinase